jgi:hypothetical protein
MVGGRSRRNRTITVSAGVGVVISTLLAVTTNIAADAVPRALRRWTGDPRWIWIASLVLLVAFVVVTLAERRASVRDDDTATSSASEPEPTGLMHVRYRAASQRFGAADSGRAVAGARELAALADDSLSLRQLCIDLLCDRLRRPYSADPAQAAGERQVRKVIIQLIRMRLTTGAAVNWWGRTFDFSDTDLDGVSLDGIALNGSTLSFVKARIEGSGLSFEGLRADSGVLDLSDIQVNARLSFNKTVLCGGIIKLDRIVTERGSTIAFRECWLSGGSISVSDADLRGLVDFEGTHLSISTGEKMSAPLVTFEGAVIRSGEVSFAQTVHVVDDAPVEWLTSTQQIEFPTLVDLSHVVMEGGKLSYRLARWHATTEKFDRIHMKGGEIAFTAITISVGVLSFRNAQVDGGRIGWDRAYLGVSHGWGDEPDWLSELTDASPEELLRPYLFQDRYSELVRRLRLIDFYDARMTGGTLSFLDADMIYGLVSFVGMTMAGGEIDCSEATLSKGVFVLWRADIRPPARATFGLGAPILIVDQSLAEVGDITHGPFQRIYVMSSAD